MANQKPKKAPGKFRKPGESFQISAMKEKMARESGRLDTVRTIPLERAMYPHGRGGSAKQERRRRG
jgi:hypothetical protein